MDEHESPQDAEPGQFSYRASKDGKVFIAWHGKTVTTLKGREAARFLSKVESGDEHAAQQLMARATGNFKRGNERLAAESP
jgi:hypothetical protein